ncbi:hypothetical protein MMC28_009677 [Mycoblastus sanguinarius]|nr:hypothetical protein [Mycoblastus sanguinarius]
MESDTREPRRAQVGQKRAKRAMSGEKSPAGSVKRARQRAAAGLPPERPQMPSYPAPLSARPSERSPQKVPSPSDRTQYPQYPIQGGMRGPGPPKSIPLASLRPRKGAASPTSPQDYVGRGPPPQRPPRPNYGPPMLQSSNSQGNQQPSFQQYPIPPIPEQPSRNYWEDSYLGESSGSSRPLTTSSTGTGSSTDSIPEFPPIPSMPSIPTYQPPPRRNLGPPPSARKGGSSYYSQISFVPPIPEEMSESRSSNASSHVIPVSWGNGPPEYYMGAGIDEEDEDEVPPGSSGRTSRTGDHDESTGLVRKGSRGKPLIPFLETVESGDESSDRGSGMRELDWQARQDERFRPAFRGGAGTDAIGRHDFRNNGRLPAYSGYESDATFLESPRSRSPMPTPLKTSNTPGAALYFETPSPNGSPIDPRVNQILGHLEKGGAIASSGTASPSTGPSMSEKGFKRPPRLNLEAPKEGVGRGSATSLPELIRRATRLASNLDRGKTASRIGMLDMLNAKDRENREKAAKGSHEGSISDILAAFPSPAPTTPNGQRPSGWPSPSPHGKSALSRAHTATYGSSGSRMHRRRMCCGLPIWAFVLLLIIFLLLIAAAIIIPVTLVVLPREHKNSSPDLASCDTSDPCAHGGSNVIVNNKCRCICANGFTYSSCNTPPDMGCTTSDISAAETSSTYKNSTLGSSIPRLLTDAQNNFSIPITSYILLSLFSVNNLSCSSENALVTVNQKSQRRDLHTPFLLPELHFPQDTSPLELEQLILPPTRTHHHISRILQARGSAQTSNDIIFAPPSVDASAPAAATPSLLSSTSSTVKPITQQVLDFARTAVLFIFQETSSLATATKALEKLQILLENEKTFDASQTNAGGNITVDLSALTVGFGNGTLYGGKGS